MKLQPEMQTSQIISTQINEVNKLPLMMQLTTTNEEESKTIVESEEQAMAPAAVNEAEAFTTAAAWDP